MRKFKPNKMTTFMFFMLDLWIPLCIGIPLMCWLLGAYDWMKMGLVCLIMIPMDVIFFSMLNLVTYPFTEYNVFLEDETFSWEGTKVWYHEVTKIVFDRGSVRKYGSSEPCCVDFYAGDKMLVSITHPSLIMSFLVIRRCKNAKLRYARIEEAVWIWLIVLGMSVAMGLYGKYAGQL